MCLKLTICLGKSVFFSRRWVKTKLCAGTAGQAGFADNLMSYLILWPPEEEWKWHELQVYAEFICWLGCGLDRVPSFYSALMLFGLFLNFIRKKKLPDSLSLHGSVIRLSLLKGISAQIVSAAVSVIFWAPPLRKIWNSFGVCVTSPVWPYY